MRGVAWRGAIVLVLSLAFGFLGLYLVVGAALFQAETYRMRDASFFVLVGCTLAFCVAWFAPSARVSLLCRYAGVRVPYARATLVHVVSMFGAVLTPSNAGVGPATAVALGHLGVPLGISLGVVVQVFVLDLVFFAWSVPLGLGYLSRTGAIEVPPGAELAAYATVALAIVAALVLSRRPRLVARMVLASAKLPVLRRFEGRLRRAAGDYHRGMEAYLGMPGWRWLLLHFVTFAGWFSGFLLLWLLMKLYGVDIGLPLALAAMSGITLVSHLIPTPGGSGFIEAVVGLGVVGATTGSVAAALLVWRMALYYGVFLAGPLAALLLYRSAPVAGVRVGASATRSKSRVR